MSGKHVEKNQPTSFEFNSANLEKINKILKKYPSERKKSAVMPLLDIAQRQHDNWIPYAAIKKIAEILEMPHIKVYEVATFYSMYNLAPVGKYFFEDLNEETAIKIFEGIKSDQLPKFGSQKGRIGFEPNKRLTLVKN